MRIAIEKAYEEAATKKANRMGVRIVRKSLQIFTVAVDGEETLLTYARNYNTVWEDTVRSMERKGM